MNEKTVEKLSQKLVNTKHGKFTLISYKDAITDETHLVLKKGKILKSKPTLVRVQQTNYLHDMLQVEEYGSRWSLDEAMKKINKSGSGLIILIDGGKDKEEEIQDLKKSYKQSIPGGIDVRRIGAGSQILRDLGVEKITLMGSKTRYPSISGFGLEVVKYIQK